MIPPQPNSRNSGFSLSVGIEDAVFGVLLRLVLFVMPRHSTCQLGKTHISSIHKPDFPYYATVPIFFAPLNLDLLFVYHVRQKLL